MVNSVSNFTRIILHMRITAKWIRYTLIMQVSRNIIVKKTQRCFPFNRLEETAIHRLIEQSEVLFFEKGQLIFQEGAPGNHLYLILEGKVSVLKEKGGLSIAVNRKM
ncbi:MAG: cyclic nucleotide-binding domain-containing protein, partial [Chloroflexi bacterium]|nr:cyclic nucleotide-binding domain-containing protein [Chloroflexota bacterium]